VKQSDAVFELAKMAVRPSHQGRGLGERLGRAAIQHARERGAATIFLETNDMLQNAIRLYARLGFVHAPRPHPSPYVRSNVYMELRLSKQ
jgi:GNAT superfamily N-acetyltransferase